MQRSIQTTIPFNKPTNTLPIDQKHRPASYRFQNAPGKDAATQRVKTDAVLCLSHKEN